MTLARALSRLLPLVVMGLLTAPPAEAIPRQDEVELAGRIELAHRIATEPKYQRGRTLAQAVAHYRIAVLEWRRDHPGETPSFALLVDDGYLLCWATTGNGPATLGPRSDDSSGFRLLNDGPLPEFAYLSWGLEHPMGEGEWAESSVWRPTNIQHQLEVRPRVLSAEEQWLAIGLQLAAPVQVTFQSTRAMPVSYAEACTRSSLALLDTAMASPRIEGLGIWVIPGGQRYAIGQTDATGTLNVKVFGFAKDSLDPRSVGSALTDDMVQIWPIPEGAEAPFLLDAGRLKELLAQKLPKADEPREAGDATAPSAP